MFSSPIGVFLFHSNGNGTTMNKFKRFHPLSGFSYFIPLNPEFEPKTKKVFIPYRGFLISFKGKGFDENLETMFSSPIGVFLFHSLPSGTFYNSHF